MRLPEDLIMRTQELCYEGEAHDHVPSRGVFTVFP